MIRYRFPDGEGIMAKSMVLPGHSGVTYPGKHQSLRVKLRTCTEVK